MWIWRRNLQRERCVTAFKFDCNTPSDDEMNMTMEWPGDSVQCAIQFGDYHVLGTKVYFEFMLFAEAEYLPHNIA